MACRGIPTDDPLLQAVCHVDAADGVVWRKTLGQTGAGLAAEGNDSNQIRPATSTGGGCTSAKALAAEAV